MKKIGKLNFGPRWYGKNANDEVGYRNGRGELVCRVCGKEYRKSTNK